LRADNNIANTDTRDPFAKIEPATDAKKHLLNKHNTAIINPQKPAQQSPSISDTGVELEHILNFLKGAGIESSGIADTINANTFYLIGQLLSRSLQGAIQVLWARARIKSELGLEVTIVHGRGNNPLKFSPSAQESLIKLLGPQSEAYMPANEAIDEAFSDIGAHEMAVMAGMRSALHDVLKRFNPENLEQRLQKKSPISIKIPIHKQAMLWDLFQDLYDEIEKEAQDDFNRLFGRAFSKAYDDQLRTTKNNR
jgi:type VI secretion system FHA domain protein